jgi:hypothetical protein
MEERGILFLVLLLRVFCGKYPYKNADSQSPEFRYTFQKAAAKQAEQYNNINKPIIHHQQNAENCCLHFL